MYLLPKVADYLGMDVGQMIRKRFADGELYIQIQESNPAAVMSI
jgi:ribose-phosphate pyrophosphokinase